MPSAMLAAATDIIVIVGAAAVAAAALNPQKTTLRTSLGDECEDDVLVSPEIKDAVGETNKQESLPQHHADDDKKAPTVIVEEIAVTPPVAELPGNEGFFAGAKAA